MRALHLAPSRRAVPPTFHRLPGSSLTPPTLAQIVVQDQSRTETQFKVKPSTKWVRTFLLPLSPELTGKIMDAYAKRNEQDRTAIRLILNGEKI